MVNQTTISEYPVLMAWLMHTQSYQYAHARDYVHTNEPNSTNLELNQGLLINIPEIHG